MKFNTTLKFILKAKFYFENLITSILLLCMKNLVKKQTKKNLITENEYSKHIKTTKLQLEITATIYK